MTDLEKVVAFMEESPAAAEPIIKLAAAIMKNQKDKMTDREKVEAFMVASPESIRPLVMLINAIARSQQNGQKCNHVLFTFRKLDQGRTCVEVQHDDSSFLKE